MNNLIVSPAPHAHCGDTVRKNMLNVIIALIPAYLVSLYYFGLGAFIVSATAVVACVLFEFLIQRFLLKQKNSIGDCSAILTGLLLGFNLPSNLPIWMVIVGALVAIGVAKMSFGGLGNNLFNPALVGRVFLLISFPAPMTTWPRPMAWNTAYLDAETAATPLSLVKEHGANALPGMWDMLIGNMGGSLGEVSAIALLIGGVYLIATRTITWHIPVSILATVAVFTGILYATGVIDTTPLFHLCAGGMMLGAIFMATDYVTSPMSASGQIVYGICIAIITVVIRVFGAYPEGMSFAILIMNAVTPLLNTYLHPKRFGATKK